MHGCCSRDGRELHFGISIWFPRAQQCSFVDVDAVRYVFFVYAALAVSSRKPWKRSSSWGCTRKILSCRLVAFCREQAKNIRDSCLIFLRGSRDLIRVDRKIYIAATWMFTSRGRAILSHSKVQSYLTQRLLDQEHARLIEVIEQVQIDKYSCSTHLLHRYQLDDLTFLWLTLESKNCQYFFGRAREHNLQFPSSCFLYDQWIKIYANGAWEAWNQWLRRERFTLIL